MEVAQQQKKALRERLRAKRTSPGGPGTYRLATSIRLPWALGLTALLILALVTAVLVGRTAESTLRVPQVVLDYQEQITRDAAQSVRRSLNAGVTDLDQLAHTLPAANGPGRTDLHETLQEFAAAHPRYRSVMAVDRGGGVVARAGSTPPEDGLASMASIPQQAGMREVPRPIAQIPLIEQFAPVAAKGVSSLVGLYEPRFMRFALDVSRPGNAWVVNRSGQVVGTRVGGPRLRTLPRLALRQAAARGGAGLSGAQSVGGSIDTQEVVGHAPVSGSGPAGRLGFAVVATRDVGSFSLPQTDARRQGLMAGVALGVLALVIFGWLYVVVVSPVLRLQGAAERLAHGDLTKSVEIVRYDEIGLIARALERLRITSIRSRVRSRTAGGDNGRAGGAHAGPPSPSNGSSGSAANGS